MSIDLPTIVQRVRVDAKSMAAAEKQANSLSAALDRLQAASAGASGEAKNTARSESLAEEATRAHTEATKDDTQATEKSTRERRRNSDENERNRRTTTRLADVLERMAASQRRAASMGAVLGRVMSTIKFPAIAGAVSLAAGAVSALGGSLLALSAQIAPAVGVLGGIPALLAGVAGTGIAGLLVFKGIGDAAKAVTKYGATSKQAKEALKGLTREQRVLVGSLLSVQKAYSSVTKVTTASAGRGFEAAFANVKSLLPQVIRGMEKFGAVAGRAASRFTGALTDTRARNSIDLVFAQGARSANTLGLALGPVVKSLLNIAVAGRGVADRFSDLGLRWARSFQRVTDDRKRLEGFFTRGADLAGSLGRTIGNLGRTIFHVGEIANQSVGINFVNSMEAATARWERFTKSTTGKSKIGDYFRDAGPAMRETNLLLKDILIGFVGLGDNQSLVGFLRGLRTELLPAVLDLADGVSERLGPAIVSAATAFIKFQSVLSYSPLIGVVQSFADLTIAITDLIRSVPGLSTVVASLIALRIALAGIAAVGKFSGVTALLTGLSGSGAAAGKGAKGLTAFLLAARGVEGTTGLAAGAGKKFADALGAINTRLPRTVSGLRTLAGLGVGLGVVVVAMEALARAKNAIDSAMGNGPVNAETLIGDLATPGPAKSLDKVREALITLKSRGLSEVSGSTPWEWAFNMVAGTRAAEEQVRNLDDALTTMVASGGGKQAAEVLSGLGISAEEARDLLPGYTAAVDAAGDAGEDASTKTQSFADALSEAKAKTQAARDALQKLIDAYTVLNEGALSQVEASLALQQSQVDLAASFTSNGKGLNANKQALIDSVKAIDQMAQANLNAKVPVEEVERRTRAQVEALLDMAEQYGLDRTEVQKFIDTIMLSPSKRVTKLEEIGAAELAAKIAALETPGRHLTKIQLAGLAAARAELAAFYDDASRRITLPIYVDLYGPAISPDRAEDRTGGPSSAETERRARQQARAAARRQAAQAAVRAARLAAQGSGRATGGLLTGPGNPRSDNLVLRASPGEYLVNAPAASKHRPLLDAINYGSLPGYADGGIVGLSAPSDYGTPASRHLRHLAHQRHLAHMKHLAYLRRHGLRPPRPRVARRPTPDYAWDVPRQGNGSTMFSDVVGGLGLPTLPATPRRDRRPAEYHREVPGGDTYMVTVNNPVPEPASESIPLALRRASYTRGR